MAFEDLTVCAKAEIADVAEAFKATHMLSLLHPGDEVQRPPGIKADNHQTYWFKDIADPRNILAPKPKHIARIDRWETELPPDSRLLIHCFAGIGRSPAVALGFLSKTNSPQSAMRHVLKIRPEATPNPVIVALWDERLGHKGALIEAVQASRANSS